jgi:predicted esterase
MKIEHKLIDGSSDELLLFVLTNGENVLNDFTAVKASIVHCHINSDGHDITQEELFKEQNVNHLMSEFVQIIKEYEQDFPNAKHIVIGDGENAEVALDILLKENELVEGGILIKPILNVSLSDGIRIEDHTKVLIVEGTREDDASSWTKEKNYQT